MRLAELVAIHVGNTKPFLGEFIQHAGEVICPLGLERNDDVGWLTWTSVPVERNIEEESARVSFGSETNVGDESEYFGGATVKIVN